MTSNEPTARLGSKTVTEAEVRAFCAAVGLPYPLHGGSEDGPELDTDRQPRQGHGVRMPDRRRRVARAAGNLRDDLAHGGAVKREWELVKVLTNASAKTFVYRQKATPPAVEPLTVRDARRRERLHLAGQWALLFVGVGLLVGLVMGGYLGGGHWADHLGGGR